MTDLIRTANQLRQAAAKGRFAIRTMGEGYSLDTGQTIAASVARAELQGELFNEPGASAFVPQEDGLFAGFSQTWRLQ